MRWLRWAVGSIVAVALLVFTGVVVANGSRIRSCEESVTVGPTFTGEVLAKQGGTVTFRVDEVQEDPLILGEPHLGLAPGQQLTVDYGEDARFLHTHDSYFVPVHGRSVDDLRSSVNDGPCGSFGIDTRHANGSEINTGLFTREGFEPYWPRLGLALAAVAAVALLIRWRINVKHPRLTIEGKPLTKH